MSNKKEIHHSDLVQVKPITDNQKEVFKSWKDGKNQFLCGCAGTGKTFVSLAVCQLDDLVKDFIAARLCPVHGLAQFIIFGN